MIIRDRATTPWGQRLTSWGKTASVLGAGLCAVSCLPTASGSGEGNGDASDSAGDNGMLSSSGTSAGGANAGATNHGASGSGMSGVGAGAASSAAGSGGRAPTAGKCTPAATQACSGAAACKGMQTCTPDYNWGACTCADSIAIEDWGAAMATADCAWSTPCLAASEQDAYCSEEKLIFEQIFQPTFQQEVAANDASYDGAIAKTCIDALTKSNCATFSDDISLVRLKGCSGTFAGFAGLKKAGAACTSDYQCASLSCSGTSVNCSGSCDALPSAEGQACSDASPCQDSYQCVNGVCSGIHAGDPCGYINGADQACTDSFVECQTNGSTGVCKLEKNLYSVPAGQPCSTANQQLCVPGQFCTTDSSSSGTCVGPASSGGPCQSALPDQCPSGQYCKTPSTATFKGTCTPRGGVGQPCGTYSNDSTVVLESGDCASGLWCNGTTCVKLQPVGGSCKSATDCYSEACTGGICQPLSVCSGSGSN